MVNALHYINNDSYIKISLVGNNYTGNKITKKDINVKLVFDKKNKHDKNAIKVVSIKNNKSYDIGFISKEKTYLVKNLFNRLKFITIIKRVITNDIVYYYLIYKT